ncbi:MAG TPA: helicase C-terminal domain-containing protein [bacterium]|nr:helicase C-terminal domain-containing protein [bacterium]HQI47951.1 helicase C-terminal domain-containing protein [bacterium]HQJ64628.1 helicase C-terminal domain-containing protein [bacterium]
MSAIGAYLSEAVRERIRATIDEAGGNEAFFIGYTEEDLIVHDVAVAARGHKTAVPVITQLAAEADVVIHNHPSGHLTPSEADLAIAAALDPFSVAFYIVDNQAEQIYVVVEPFAKREIVPLDADVLIKIVQQGGAVSRELPGYEERPQQEEMIRGVVEAFNSGKIATIEAGTGTGKTLAYLIPAIRWALQNKERVVVSTNTINLQEQLIKKDLPFLQKVLPDPFTAVLVKGRGNYACLRKVGDLSSELDLQSDEEEEREELKQLIDWARNSSDGSKADLAYIPREVVWEKIAAESDTCTRSRCPFFRDCFVNKARRHAARANILVVNHHLLFADLSIRYQIGSISEAAVLPPYTRIIFDEAHHLEDVATNYFGDRVTRAGILRILSRLHRQQKQVLKGHLHTALYKLRRRRGQVDGALLARVEETITGRLAPEVAALHDATQELMDHLYEAVKGFAQENQGYEIKLRLVPEVVQALLVDSGLSRLIQEYVTSMTDLAVGLAHLGGWVHQLQLGPEDDLASTVVEIKAASDRLAAAAAVIGEVVFKQDEENIRWIEVRPGYKGRHIVRFQSSPLDIAPMMQKAVYESYETIVMTSATLAVENSFEFLSKRIGLSALAPERRSELLLPAPFDYEKQAVVCIPTDIPDPNDRSFSGELGKLIYRSVAISNGRAFVLFTSYGLLTIIYRQLEDSFKKLGITPLRQGEENRHELLARFRRDKSSVLFATDSFWEGVDVEGEALENVIISKLPFKVPNEPVIEARWEAIERTGGNPFMEYAVPLAVLKFKQGFGRLIRRKSDRGAVIVLDNRVVKKAYGKRFMRSLPPCRTVIGGKEQVFAELVNFFNRR